MTARLLYLHGFNSAPQSRKASWLREQCAARGLESHFACPALPPEPAEAIALIEAELSRYRAAGVTTVTLLGSSLGGFYATHLTETQSMAPGALAIRAILVNPAVYPARDLVKYLGPQQNLYTGERYVLTTAAMQILQALEAPRITPERYLLLVETGDEVLDYREAVARYAGARQIVIPGGDHTLRSFPEHLDTILAFAGLV